MKLQKWGSALACFLKENVLSLGLFVGVLVILLYGLQSAQVESKEEELRIVKESIIRSIVTCYSIEGSYPADLTHLQENYGLSIDERKYAVQYMVFASNIMPDVTVIEVAQ